MTSSDKHCCSYIIKSKLICTATTHTAQVYESSNLDSFRLYCTRIHGYILFVSDAFNGRPLQQIFLAALLLAPREGGYFSHNSRGDPLLPIFATLAGLRRLEGTSQDLGGEALLRIHRLEIVNLARAAEAGHDRRTQRFRIRRARTGTLDEKSLGSARLGIVLYEAIHGYASLCLQVSKSQSRHLIAVAH